MFDFHMHSVVSFDGKATPEEMAQAALKQGLREICFTDHLDYELGKAVQVMVFDTEVYNAAYDRLSLPGLKIRRGVEMGLKEYNQQQVKQDLQRRDFDFVLGSIHFVDEMDVYFEEYWEGKTVSQGERRFLEQTLACVRVHEDYDVLAHLTYLSKTRGHPCPRPISYEEHREIIDEILRVLVSKGKGLELNTSGVDRCGSYLPSIDYFKRFKELGGEIVTVGSDSHAPDRVGQYAHAACQMLKDLFGHVCTFEARKPIFHT